MSCCCRLRLCCLCRRWGLLGCLCWFRWLRTRSPQRWTRCSESVFWVPIFVGGRFGFPAGFRSRVCWGGRRCGPPVGRSSHCCSTPSGCMSFSRGWWIVCPWFRSSDLWKGCSRALWSPSFRRAKTPRTPTCPDRGNTFFKRSSASPPHTCSGCTHRHRQPVLPQYLANTLKWAENGRRNLRGIVSAGFQTKSRRSCNCWISHCSNRISTGCPDNCQE